MKPALARVSAATRGRMLVLSRNEMVSAVLLEVGPARLSPCQCIHLRALYCTRHPGRIDGIKVNKPVGRPRPPRRGQAGGVARSVVFIPDSAWASADAARLTQICRNRLPPRPSGSKPPLVVI